MGSSKDPITPMCITWNAHDLLSSLAVPLETQPPDLLYPLLSDSEFYRVEEALFSAFDDVASRGLLSDSGSSMELTSKKWYRMIRSIAAEPRKIASR